ncbi:MAG TPA: hypothetical protein VHB27_12995 [Rhodopila sp.]|uniref:hypothetical protein n=1 Tax=Rhodopila sp. TaxID=2480087 RepID=UPI002CD18557|nr:hypothetical protein [Rhodopila sp.]HVY16134.1 hypothetical protein [Rhodopila sp.]
MFEFDPPGLDWWAGRPDLTDTVTRAIRSRMMSAVRGRDAAPARAVRSALFAAGDRYRLVGKPCKDAVTAATRESTALKALRTKSPRRRCGGRAVPPSRRLFSSL